MVSFGRTFSPSSSVAPAFRCFPSTEFISSCQRVTSCEESRPGMGSDLRASMIQKNGKFNEMEWKVQQKKLKTRDHH
jgi:hypothetical protein